MVDHESQPAVPNRTIVERKSDQELVATRSFDAASQTVFEAWTTPDLFMRWWAPKSMGVPLLSCEMDVRAGGKYRLEFGHSASESFAFYGKYIEVAPGARLVWTNDEGEDGALTTVTFEDKGGKTLLVYCDRYPSKAALDEAFGGMELGMSEQFAQLDELLGSLGRP
jgi:uncharacterized protein YndB with AHSA1/START domain